MEIQRVIKKYDWREYYVSEAHKEYIKRKLLDEIRVNDNSTTPFDIGPQVTSSSYHLVAYSCPYEIWMKQLDEFIAKLNTCHCYKGVVTLEGDLHRITSSTDADRVIHETLTEMGFKYTLYKGKEDEKFVLSSGPKYSKWSSTKTYSLCSFNFPS